MNIEEASRKAQFRCCPIFSGCARLLGIRYRVSGTWQQRTRRPSSDDSLLKVPLNCRWCSSGWLLPYADRASNGNKSNQRHASDLPPELVTTLNAPPPARPNSALLPFDDTRNSLITSFLNW